MTGRFETLVYTDCRPGQGLQGAAGLQFQARSAGADAAAMALVQRALLYEPPAGWMQQRRPVADYPPSFAHIADGYWATARGVYLGKEANGSREGNQLTHSVVTKDPDSYGLIRPAQLFGAPFWTSQPVDGTTCPPVEEGWQPGSFDAASVQQYVRDHPDCARLLATLVSILAAVHQPQARRLLFIAEQVEPVLRWLTAATLLLPQRRALEIGFKVFTTNPAYAVQPVLAVHPDWEFPAGVDRDLGYVVVDLVADRWSKVPVDPTAVTWAELFTVEDPYDVTDAVEVAAASGLEPVAAQQLALAAVLGRPPAGEHAMAVVSWLANGPQDLLEAYGTTLVDVLGASGDLPVPVLRRLDQATRTGGRYGERAATVRLALLAAEVAAAVAGDVPSIEAVPPLPPSEQRATQAAECQRVVAAGLSTAAGTRFDAVLRVAARFGVPVSMEETKEATAAFVTDWLNYSDRRYDPACWPDGNRFVDLLSDRLTQQVTEDPGCAAEIGARWWRQMLAYAVEPRNGFEAAVLAAAMAGSTNAQRYDLVAERLRAACEDSEPADRVHLLVSVLWQQTPPTGPELDLVYRYARTVGAFVDADVINAFVAGERRAGGLTGEALELCRRFQAESLVRELGPEVAQLLTDDDRVREVCRKLASHPPAGKKAKDGEQAEEQLDDLAGVSPEVLSVRRKELAGALYGAVPAVTLRLLPRLPPTVVKAYAERLAAASSDNPAARDLAIAFCVLQPDCSDQWPAPAGVTELLSEPLTRWARRAAETSVAEVTDEVHRLSNPEQWSHWQTWITSHGPHRRRLRWRR